MNRSGLLVLGLAVGCGGDEETFETELRDGTRIYEDWAEPADCVPITYYEDLDGDGYGVDGTALEGETCRPLAGYATEAGDCDDRSSGVSPGAVEICDGKDNDCDGAIDDDDGVQGAPSWFVDEDGDGYGTAEVVTVACEGPDDAALLTGDCDDEDATTHPGRSEDLEDGIDNNCDDLVDFVGTLDGTWSTAVGSGTEPGARDCELSWMLHGVWANDLCPDCALSFWMEPEDELADDPLGCVLPDQNGFGLHVLGSVDAGFYLGVTYQYTYVYYGYSYYYYGTPAAYYTYYNMVPMPDIPVTWDGDQVVFEKGPLDELSGGGAYVTDWLGFAGTIE